MTKMLRVRCDVADAAIDKAKEINKIRVLKGLEPVTDTEILHFVTSCCINRITVDEDGELIVI